ncbi:MAG: phage portal protein [Gammaproteobacteria bacterium]|nr:phage portal protein [Gammaproteobacteria bacterium]
MNDKVKPSESDWEAFGFGEAEPVLNGVDIMGMFQSYWNGEYYQPPVDLNGLAKSLNANPHHSSALQVKRNIISSSYKPNKWLGRADFTAWAMDFLVFANGYLEKVDNVLGNTLRFKHSPGKYMRRAKDGQYLFVPNYYDRHEFKAGSIFHLKDYDVNQEFYGVPSYLAGLQSAWLNESATLFRRRYYDNGTHAGFIMYMNDALHKENDIDAIRQALRDSKGPGNFRNMFLYAPGGKKDGIQILPIAEVQAKDEFFNIKNISRDDVLASHRVPVELMSLVPNNTGGFGDVFKVSKVFNRNELMPLQARFEELNEWIGFEVVKFDEYKIEVTEE